MAVDLVNTGIWHITLTCSHSLYHFSKYVCQRASVDDDYHQLHPYYHQHTQLLCIDWLKHDLSVL